MVSSFGVVLGNAVLHFALFYLAYEIEVPTEEEMAKLLSSTVKDGDYQCVSVDELASAVKFSQVSHNIICVTMIYLELHLNVLRSIAQHYSWH